jgi:alpha-mannosidase
MAAYSTEEAHRINASNRIAWYCTVLYLPFWVYGYGDGDGGEEEEEEEMVVYTIYYIVYTIYI